MDIIDNHSHRHHHTHSRNHSYSQPQSQSLSLSQSPQHSRRSFSDTPNTSVTSLSQNNLPDINSNNNNSNSNSTRWTRNCSCGRYGCQCNGDEGEENDSSSTDFFGNLTFSMEHIVGSEDTCTMCPLISSASMPGLAYLDTHSTNSLTACFGSVPRRSNASLNARSPLQLCAATLPTASRSLILVPSTKTCEDAFVIAPRNPSMPSHHINFPINQPLIMPVKEAQTFGWVRPCRCPGNACSSPSTAYFPARLVEISRLKGDWGPRNGLAVRVVETVDVNRGNYMTLAYCPGASLHDTPWATTTKTLDRNMQEIPWDGLPRMFQDAFRTAIGLGIMYMWIDSLCHVQDDESDVIDAPMIVEHAISSIVVASVASTKPPAPTQTQTQNGAAEAGTQGQTQAPAPGPTPAQAQPETRTQGQSLVARATHSWNSLSSLFVNHDGSNPQTRRLRDPDALIISLNPPSENSTPTSRVNNIALIEALVGFPVGSTSQPRAITDAIADYINSTIGNEVRGAALTMTRSHGSTLTPSPSPSLTDSSDSLIVRSRSHSQDRDGSWSLHSAAAAASAVAASVGGLASVVPPSAGVGPSFTGRVNSSRPRVGPSGLDGEGSAQQNQSRQTQPRRQVTRG